MGGEGRVYCRRCMLEDIGEDALVQSLNELMLAMPPEEKSDDMLYASRLDICRNCDELNGGTCMKCGCYVEFRALKKRMHCPLGEEKW